MKKTEILSNNIQVYEVNGSVYRAIIPFDDGSFLTILFKVVEIGMIQPCNFADEFIYNFLAIDIRRRIYNLTRCLSND